MDEMVLLPAEGITEQQTTVDRMPWLERGERGVIRSWFATIKWAMVQPNRLIRATPENSSIGGAWAYAVLTGFAFLAIGLFLPSVFAQLPLIGMPGGLMRFSLMGIGLSVIATGVGFALLIYLWALSAHGLLRITGGGVRSFARTSHAIFYSAGAGILIAVPCCGPWLGWIWWAVSATNMVKEAHRIHGGRAAFAVLALPTVCAIALPLGYWALIMFIMLGMRGGGMFGGPGAAWTPQNMPVTTLSSSLMQYSFQNSGIGPQHAIELMLAGNLQGWGAGGPTPPFCYPGTQTTAASIPVNAGTLQSFQALPRTKQLGEIQQVLNATPANVIAHRFGDYVFTYHGATINTMDPTLWMVVMLPDPAVNPAPAPGDAVHIGLGNYSVTSTTFGQLPALVQAQNQYRATLGLPPLPDLSTVTHGNPALPVAATQPTQK
ncbi:MAG: YIP1 family protein [Phycisphaerales bacterium]|nr:YIP1 family protein [Phycisphaerales bacterium]